tara:strand:- start:2031 stop:2153 length:123 start_codon:yes stop_codon:yes gene_type:complete
MYLEAVINEQRKMVTRIKEMPRPPSLRERLAKTFPYIDVA